MAETSEEFDNLRGAVDLYRQRHGINATPPLISEDWDVILTALRIAARVMESGLIEAECDKPFAEETAILTTTDLAKSIRAGLSGSPKTLVSTNVEIPLEESMNG